MTNVVPQEKFSTPETGQCSRGRYPYFSRDPNFLITQAMILQKKPPCQNQLDPSNHFDKVLTCDKTQTDIG